MCVTCAGIVNEATKGAPVSLWEQPLTYSVNVFKFFAIREVLFLSIIILTKTAIGERSFTIGRNTPAVD